jgi:hypothetical protein
MCNLITDHHETSTDTHNGRKIKKERKEGRKERKKGRDKYKDREIEGER